MTGHNRPPTPREVRLARDRLGLSQGEFAKVLGIARQGTISTWERGESVPLITVERMEELIAEYVGKGVRPARPDGFALDPRSYALGTLANLGDDVAALRSLADRMAAKVQAATATLGGATPPSVVPDSAIAEGRDALGASAEKPTRRRHGGHR